MSVYDWYRIEEAKDSTENIWPLIVTDPEICHDKLTFRGTRIMDSQVLDQVAKGMAWETIKEEWWGKVPGEALPNQYG
jgi:uncharacterized protein (DUF433 family)